MLRFDTLDREQVRKLEPSESDSRYMYTGPGCIYIVNTGGVPSVTKVTRPIYGVIKQSYTGIYTYDKFTAT